MNEPVVIIYVDDSTDKIMPKAWWVNAKSSETYSDLAKSYVLIPESQRFGEHSIGHFKKLCGYRLIDRELKTIKLSREDAGYLSLSGSIKKEARIFYTKWSNSHPSEKTNRGLGEICISRVGWRHISRKGRKPELMLQSWQLLGAARRIIMEIDKAFQISQKKTTSTSTNEYVIKDFISLRAKILFPQRHESVIQVLLQRKRVFDLNKGLKSRNIWFYSVYEPRRGRSVQ
jgi:hypothetical protein